MVKEEKYEVIKCPKCGGEYLPLEIIYPKSFFGGFQKINRTDGKIDNVIGYSPMDLNEVYQCDFCGCRFKVQSKVSFKTSELCKYDMSQYSTPLFEPKLTLFEGD